MDIENEIKALTQYVDTLTTTAQDRLEQQQRGGEQLAAVHGRLRKSGIGNCNG